ncbi:MULTISPECIES: SemiSWEET transporter [unclassified Coleofasciculus]|uniref:SemiSWEET transporter n=1 Tax=unclassified Coleofasciculus TaxID=2692782 RepID=UPI0018830F99|nr:MULTISPECIES: SemiSWEET transporter [unclassified Coleofasciculus]MBE9125277.1 SemiSWEET transporter [Coleofasciculus sp. LEGE 07081]MBE9147058.1 SemiSWEET transporter [Coleofasciculus sp. LEGE 07092]
MKIVTLLGLLAGTLTTISFLPQVIKTWKSKSAKDISLGMFLTFCTGVFFWIIYGTLVRDLPIIVTNLATLVLASTVLGMKLKYERARR